MKKLIISIFILLFISSNSYAKIITFSKCYSTEQDTSKLVGIWKDVWAPSNGFRNDYFEVNNIYLDTKSFKLSNYYKFSKNGYKLVKEGSPFKPPEDNTYNYFDNKKKFSVNFKKENYLITYTHRIKDMSNSGNYKKKLLNKGRKLTDLYRIVVLDIKNGTLELTTYETEYTVYSSIKCDALSNKYVKNNTSDIYHSFSSSSFGNNINEVNLYYNSATGGMKECATKPVNGRCVKFKPFNRNSYKNNSLFYNSKTNKMQTCIGAVLASGECSDFGDYIYSSRNRDKLYYDNSSMKMSTCKVLDYNGGCEVFDIRPKKRRTSNIYVPTIPQSSADLINLGLRMMSGSCTIGISC